jgi:transposase
LAAEPPGAALRPPDFVRFFTKIPLPRGSVILMDNLKAHHSKEVEEVFNQKGYIALFTPPYSPRCNPIEKIFGIFKPMYRSRCIDLTSHKKDDFRDIFIKIIKEHMTISFNSTFQNTLHFLNETLNNIAIDPGGEVLQQAHAGALTAPPNFRFVVRLYKDDSIVVNIGAQ